MRTWMSKNIPHKSMGVMTYACPNLGKMWLVTGAPRAERINWLCTNAYTSKCLHKVLLGYFIFLTHIFDIQLHFGSAFAWFWEKIKNEIHTYQFKHLHIPESEIYIILIEYFFVLVIYICICLFKNSHRCATLAKVVLIKEKTFCMFFCKLQKLIRQKVMPTCLMPEEIKLTKARTPVGVCMSIFLWSNDCSSVSSQAQSS